MLNKIKYFVDTHPIGRIFKLGAKKAVWKKVTELKVGQKIAITNSSDYSHERPEGVEWDEIVSIKKVGCERVYDIEVEGTHNFVGNGILAHNTHIIDQIGAFAEVVVANIKAGAITTKQLAADSLTAFTATIDNLLINNGLVSPIVQTDLISPLADSDTVTIQTKNLVVENASGSAEVKIVGDLTTENASVSGELYAEKITSPDLDKIQELLRSVKEDQDLLAQAATWNTPTASESAMNGQWLTANMENLYVTGQAAVNSLSISNSLSVGTDLVFQSSSIQYPVSSINTLQAPLAIQSLAMAPVEIMAGKIRIETNGDATFMGNVAVAGDLEVGGKTKLKEVQLEKLIIATTPEVSADFTSGVNVDPEVSTASGTIKTNATAGNAVIPAGLAELEIENSKIENSSLIYVTPTSSTENNVLFVKSKEAGKFTIGFTQALDIDVAFNWWVIEVTQ